MVDRIQKSITPILLLLVLGLLLTGLSPTEEDQQQQSARAQAGDTVLVWMNFVKPEKVEQYEEFVFEILIPALKKASEGDEARLAQLKQTRLLRPMPRDADDMLSYVWLMDPVVSGTSYSFASILREVHGEEEVTEYLDMFGETEAQPQVVYRTTQTAW
jgi:hypothetical protein